LELDTDTGSYLLYMDEPSDPREKLEAVGVRILRNWILKFVLRYVDS
jgi:hypothetical protein